MGDGGWGMGRVVAHHQIVFSVTSILNISDSEIYWQHSRRQLLFKEKLERT